MASIFYYFSILVIILIDIINNIKKYEMEYKVSKNSKSYDHFQELGSFILLDCFCSAVPVQECFFSPAPSKIWRLGNVVHTIYYTV